MAGLDPAIHLLKKSLAKKMDTRVKPAYDDVDHAAPNSSASTKTSRVRRFFRVMAGLDPAIHLLKKSLAKKMDTRGFGPAGGSSPRMTMWIRPGQIPPPAQKPRACG
jgi:hypothetical protein